MSQEQEKPEKTTYIARTGKGWARAPIQEEAACRALCNTYPSPGEKYKIQVFQVCANSWKVDGMGGIQAEYVEKVDEYMVPGESAEHITDMHHEMVMCLGSESEPLQDE